eukprot:869719_1
MNSPLMPYAGSNWAKYINRSSKEIWLLGGYQANAIGTNYAFKYNIDQNSFDIDTSLSTTSWSWGTDHAFSNEETLYLMRCFVDTTNSGHIATYDMIHKNFNTE